jgi:hypothetical protein
MSRKIFEKKRIFPVSGRKTLDDVDDVDIPDDATQHARYDVQ